MPSDGTEVQTESCTLFPFQAGVYWVELSAYYNAGWAVLIMGAAECMVFAWVYGARRLAGDIETMVGFKLRPHWWITWAFITPLILSVRNLSYFSCTGGFDSFLDMLGSTF